MAEQQPDLKLVRSFTPEKVAALFKKLTGREPTEEEKKDLPAWCERINARLHAGGEQRTE